MITKRIIRVSYPNGVSHIVAQTWIKRGIFKDKSFWAYVGRDRVVWTTALDRARRFDTLGDACAFIGVGYETEVLEEYSEG